jgi:hypothetical protein
MFKEVMNDLWLARISSLSNEVGLYVVLQEVLLFMDNLKFRSFSQVSSIKTFDFSTLYTTLPHDKLKTRLQETIHKAFSHRNYGSKFNDLWLARI